jgi:hypothetical protein
VCKLNISARSVLCSTQLLQMRKNMVYSNSLSSKMKIGVIFVFKLTLYSQSSAQDVIDGSNNFAINERLIINQSDTCTNSAINILNLSLRDKKSGDNSINSYNRLKNYMNLYLVDSFEESERILMNFLKNFTIQEARLAFLDRVNFAQNLTINSLRMKLVNSSSLIFSSCNETVNAKHIRLNIKS